MIKVLMFHNMEMAKFWFSNVIKELDNNGINFKVWYRQTKMVLKYEEQELWFTSYDNSEFLVGMPKETKILDEYIFEDDFSKAMTVIFSSMSA